MKLKLLLFFAVLFVTTASAQTFSLGGVNYSVISTTNNTVGVTSSASYVGELIVPSTVSNAGVSYTVVSILDAAFQNSTTLTSITIPNTVTEIRNSAFRFCTNLTSVDMGDSIASIGQLSFNACFSLTSVVIPSSVTNIGINAFEFCNTLTSVTVEWATPLSINSNVFTGVNIGMATLHIPAGTVATYQAAPVWQNFGIILPPTPATHLNFDGINDYVDCGNILPASYTKEAWISMSTVTSANNIISGSSNSGQHAFWVPNGILSAGHNGSWNAVIDSNILSLNTWYHVALSYDSATQELKLYKDGILVAINYSIPAPINGNKVTIGGFSPSEGNFLWNGSIDDIRIWNVARTADQINSSKNCELQGDETGLVAYYKFNQGIDATDNTSETTVIDETGVNNGTLINFGLTGTTSNWLAGSPITTGSIIPSVPTVTTPLELVLNETASPLTATIGSNGTGLMWYTTETDGTGTTTAPTPDTSTVGSTSYWVSSTNHSGCESQRVETVVEVAIPADHYHMGRVNNNASNAFYINNNDGLDLPNTFTVELWVKTSDAFYILTGTDEDEINNFYTFYVGQDNKLNFRISNFYDYQELFVSNQALSDDVWHHIALSRNSSNLYSFYIDGNLDSTFTPMVTIEEFNISQVGSGNAAIDEYRVWDMTRTEGQINANKNCELQGTESGLLVYYKFNQGLNAVNNTGIATIFDATANQNNATIINSWMLTGQAQNFLAGSPVATGATIPSIPTTTTLIAYELGDTTNALTATTGGSGLLWYTTETGGTGSETAPTPSTDTISTTSYWVTSTNTNDCESARVEIVVNVQETLGLQEVEALKNIKVYPNPTSGNVSISFPNSLESKITLYDLNGRLLLNTTETTTKSIIDLNNYEDGVYLLKIEVNQNEIVKRVIKY
ncbi:LamG-like jellyroll fold domain-containing protein [Bizionia psychrotolerans]|uniref:LamG-like jellyroll fold domain-containing protein n=1 Tax=Bizionia psychrotolerans TaxID=1492901 RepID=UPI00069F1638|nr:LamG-like jellyroll fold domain-containing protein [Bizionia psychrotolerans]